MIWTRDVFVELLENSMGSESKSTARLWLSVNGNITGNILDGWPRSVGTIQKRRKNPTNEKNAFFASHAQLTAPIRACSLLHVTWLESTLALRVYFPWACNWNWLLHWNWFSWFGDHVHVAFNTWNTPTIELVSLPLFFRMLEHIWARPGVTFAVSHVTYKFIQQLHVLQQLKLSLSLLSWVLGPTHSSPFAFSPLSFTFALSLDHDLPHYFTFCPIFPFTQSSFMPVAYFLCHWFWQ